MNRNILNAGHNKKKLIVFFIACFTFLGWQYSQTRKISLRFLDQEGAEHILLLPVKDKKRLFCFMRILFAEDSFAYSLLGSKPISWTCYKTSLPFVDLSMFYDSWKKHHRTLRLGWKTWLKYHHLFPLATLWTETSSHPGWISILIVNEERFNDIINKNKEDFQNVLHREKVDGYQLLREAKHRSLMSEILEGHQALLGIVLGYGRDNSWEFLKRIQNGDRLGCVWDEIDDQSQVGIKTRAAAIAIEECLSLESCPSFAGIPQSAESLSLKQEYLQTQQKVIRYYKDKDFLEATLSLLAGFRPIE